MEHPNLVGRCWCYPLSKSAAKMIPGNKTMKSMPAKPCIQKIRKVHPILKIITTADDLTQHRILSMSWKVNMSYFRVTKPIVMLVKGGWVRWKIQNGNLLL